MIGRGKSGGVYRNGRDKFMMYMEAEGSRSGGGGCRGSRILNLLTSPFFHLSRKLSIYTRLIL